jgi:hypothetical protein
MKTTSSTSANKTAIQNGYLLNAGPWATMAKQLIKFKIYEIKIEQTL